MITLHNAIRALNSSVVTIRGDIAYDANEQEVIYSKSLAEAKLAELQAQEEQAEQAQATAKDSALAKLTALGLTQAEVKALIG
jgi:DeoR/GlpR family transcriptional regulator of sugar metabolism